MSVYKKIKTKRYKKDYEKLVKQKINVNCVEISDPAIVPIVFVDDRLLRMENGLLEY